jgi:spore coat polysaccharide biosynthesis protein SpsF
MIPIQDKPVLQHLLERISNSNFWPIICTSADPSDQTIVDLAAEIGLDCFRGSLLNKIDRWARCAVFTNSEYVHIIDADDPLVDVAEILESIDEATECGLDLLRTSERSDRGYASVGMTIKSEFLLTLSHRVTSLDSNDLDVIPWELLLKPKDRVVQKKDKILIPASALNLRLTLDYENDLELISTLIKELGNTISRLELEMYLESHPLLATINEGNTALFLQNKRNQLSKNFGLGQG